MSRHILSSHTLSALLAGFAPVSSRNDATIEGLSMDSRKVKPGDLFLAIKGQRTHGLRHLREVLARGAAALAWEPHNGMNPPACDRPAVPVPDLGQVAGCVADRFYRHPSQDLNMIGITGTDGKTSVGHFIAQALDQPGSRCGLLGTLGYGLFGELENGALTTPDAVRVHAELDRMRSATASSAVMEVSSHALEQGRVQGVAFDVAVLTNLSRDHLDYHGDAAAYAAAKRKLFETPGLRHAVLNFADPFGQRLMVELAQRLGVLAYGHDARAMRDIPSVRAHAVELSRNGMAFRVETPWGRGELSCALLGRFNVQNLLAALATLLVLDVPLRQALARLSRTRVVPGRVEPFGGRQGPLVVVDYAHTPAALAHVLRALREHCHGQLWCVFGCGGDRDAGKRPLMAKAVEQHADRIIVTDDNPRTESPQAIVLDALAGFSTAIRPSVIHDRAMAIETAVTSAQAADVVLIAGKGHEAVQIVGDETRAFSDRQFVADLLGETRT